MKENYYDVRNITDFKDLINQTVKLYGDRPAFRFKKRMYKKDEYLNFIQLHIKNLKKK